MADGAAVVNALTANPVGCNPQAGPVPL